MSKFTKTVAILTSLSFPCSIAHPIYSVSLNTPVGVSYSHASKEYLSRLNKLKTSHPQALEIESWLKRDLYLSRPVEFMGRRYICGAMREYGHPVPIVIEFTNAQDSGFSRIPTQSMLRSAPKTLEFPREIATQLVTSLMAGENFKWAGVYIGEEHIGELPDSPQFREYVRASCSRSVELISTPVGIRSDEHTWIDYWRQIVSA